MSDVPVMRFAIGEYYSPMYDTRELAGRREQIWPASPREVVGINWRERRQLELCRDVFAQQSRAAFADEPTSNRHEYFASNDQYPALDAWVLEGMIRHLEPRRMIEVGCGFSTLVSAQVNREHFGSRIELTCIEPYPRDFLLEPRLPGIAGVRVEKVQDTPLSVFEQLADGDILFIDTSHTVKTGGDVTWIFHEILPRLRAGVAVHVHDFFLPGEYPEPWVMEGWGWNETYLVRSFLTFNDVFPVVWATQYMLQTHPEAVLKAFPGHRRHLRRGGASLWIRRAPAPRSQRLRSLGGRLALGRARRWSGSTTEQA